MESIYEQYVEYSEFSPLGATTTTEHIIKVSEAAQ